MLGIISGAIKKPTELAANATVTEISAYEMALESYANKYGTARSTLQLAKGERIQLEYMKVKDAKELWQKLAEDYKLKVKRLKFHIRRELILKKLEDTRNIKSFALSINRLVQGYNLCVDTNVTTIGDDGKDTKKRKMIPYR